MKRNLNQYLQKWGYIAFVIVFTAILYQIYKLDLYTWTCESEGNTGSCLLASRLYLENDNRTMAEKYMKLSCDGKYALGCFELSKMLKDDSYKKQACELGHKPACEN